MDFDSLIDDATRTCIGTLGGEAFDHVSDEKTARVTVIFDHNYRLEDIGDASIATYRPVLKAHAKDFPAPIEPGDAFVQVATGKRFEVVDIQPDSGYGLLIILHSEE